MSCDFVRWVEKPNLRHQQNQHEVFGSIIKYFDICGLQIDLLG